MAVRIDFSIIMCSKPIAANSFTQYIIFSQGFYMSTSIIIFSNIC